MSMVGQKMQDPSVTLGKPVPRSLVNDASVSSTNKLVTVWLISYRFHQGLEALKRGDAKQVHSPKR